jgi:hypothetical protein
MTATSTLEDIEAFEQAHGFASFDPCRIAERRTRIARRSLGDGRVTPSMLMRQGLPSVLAEAYCLLLYGPQQSSQLRRHQPQSETVDTVERSVWPARLDPRAQVT